MTNGGWELLMCLHSANLAFTFDSEHWTASTDPCKNSGDFSVTSAPDAKWPSYSFALVTAIRECLQTATIFKVHRSTPPPPLHDFFHSNTFPGAFVQQNLSPST